MSIIIGLVAAILIAWFGAGAIKKHAKIFYIGAVALSVVVVVVTWTGADLTFPALIKNNIWSVVARGALGTAIFIIVMMIGALKNGSNPMKRLMPIRAELSIIASIIILGHNFAYGKTYFVFLFTMTKYMPLNQIIAAITSIVMIAIMVPLMITSFYKIRKKMNGITWKKLQRFASVFYALTYVHVLLLCIPLLAQGNLSYFTTIIVYSGVYVLYLYMRLKKALLLKNVTRTKWVPVLCVVLALVVCAITGGAMHASDRATLISAENGQQEDVDVEELSEENSSLKEEEQMGEEELVVEPTEEVVEMQEDEADTNEESAVAEVNKETESDKTASIVSKTENTSSSNTSSSNTSASEGTDASNSGSLSSGTTETPAPQAPAEPEVVEPTTVYKDGSFKGTAYGYKSNVTMSVTISNDKITNVSVVSQGEDALYWAMAKDVIGRIQSAQSPYVDAVSGATISSNAIMNAVANALDAARN